MKNKWKYISLISGLVFLLSGCNLVEDDEDKFPGDQYWENPENAESFLLSVYADLRDATVKNSGYFFYSGDVRCAPITNFKPTDNMGLLINNDMKTYKGKEDGKEAGTGERCGRIYNWEYMFCTVQDANILIYELDNISGLDGDLKRRYKAEAVFLRNLAYFFMVRLFGDVPYYTEAYYAKPLPRTPMVTVLKNCLADMQAVLDDDPSAAVLAWHSADNAIRANRGAYLALMMHINMWLAGFDSVNAEFYYKEVKRLAETDSWIDNDTYKLMPIEQTSRIFMGGTVESLFEIVQNLPSGELFKRDHQWTFNVVYECLNASKPKFVYSKKFLQKLYPKDETDLRRDWWFKNIVYDEDGNIMEAQNSTLPIIREVEVIKMLNVDTYNDTTYPNAGNHIVFRFADVVLLYAEALNKLGENDKALTQLNRIRERAGATLRTSTTELDDDIYWERVRELMGEGQYFFDLVRTGKLCIPEYSVFSDNSGHRERKPNFDAGSWTWPIFRGALEQNAFISKNQYWE